MSTFKGQDNCTDILLDLIAEHESDGDYNAVIGDEHSHYKLETFSLDEVYQLMGWLLNVARRPSTAVGRYQIIRATMKTLQSRMGLEGSAKFTPELQDKMAVALMVGRGFSAWWNHRLSDDELAHGLSMEWASLPDPFHGGKSHYDGVGPNHAGTTLAHVYERIKAARAAQQSA